MLDSINTDRHEDQNQEQFCVSKGSAHENNYPFLQEFSDLISGLSTKELLSLLTNQQKNFAKTLWEAENYGGSIENCKKRLTEIYGKSWQKHVQFREHFRTIEGYYILVLLIEHKSQWDKSKKLAMLNQANDPE